MCRKRNKPSYNDVTTDEFVSSNRYCDTPSFTSAFSFPRLDMCIYEEMFYNHRKDWARFLQWFGHMPSPRLWERCRVVPDTIEFSHVVAYNGTVDNPAVTFHMSYTKGSSSYDEKYDMSIEVDGLVVVRVNHLHSWEEAVGLVRSMTAAVAAERKEAERRERALVRDIYPAKRFRFTAAL